jgi:hypothetical protein
MLECRVEGSAGESRKIDDDGGGKSEFSGQQGQRSVTVMLIR